jgi:hypothetical protein
VTNLEYRTSRESEVCRVAFMSVCSADSGVPEVGGAANSFLSGSIRLSQILPRRSEAPPPRSLAPVYLSQ